MALLDHQQIQITGSDVTLASAEAGGDTVPANDRVFLWVKNDSAGSLDVVVDVPGQNFGQDLPDVTVAVPASDERMIGPLVNELSADGIVSVSYPGGVTSLTVAAVRV